MGLLIPGSWVRAPRRATNFQPTASSLLLRTHTQFSILPSVPTHYYVLTQHIQQIPLSNRNTTTQTHTCLELLSDILHLSLSPPLSPSLSHTITHSLTHSLSLPPSLHPSLPLSLHFILSSITEYKSRLLTIIQLIRKSTGSRSNCALIPSELSIIRLSLQ